MKTITELITNDLLAEKISPKRDKYYIQQGQSILDNVDKLTKSTLINTGRMVTIKDFNSLYPDVALSDNATGVYRYLGGFYIELITKNKKPFFKWKYLTDVDLKHCEATMWNHIKENLL